MKVRLVLQKKLRHINQRELEMSMVSLNKHPAEDRFPFELLLFFTCKAIIIFLFHHN
jgi:hypothetical protein